MFIASDEMVVTLMLPFGRAWAVAMLEFY